MLPRRAAVAAGFLPFNLACAGTSLAAPPAGPAGLRGTLSIAHTMRVDPVAGLESRVSGPGFEATYRLRGRRWQARGSPPRSYLLKGSGHEALDVLRSDVKQAEGGRAELGFIGKASGDVRLVDRPDAPRETGPLLLRIRPGGRFTLGLGPLEGGEDGLRLNYYLERRDQQACVSVPGDSRGVSIYFRGVYEIKELQRCPDAEPFPGSRTGTERRPTIWGANIWNPPESGNPHPDLCRGLVGGRVNLTICGRYGRGRLRGKKALSYVTNGICAFFPRGDRGRMLPDPLAEPLFDACGQMDLGGRWRMRTVVRWSFKPVP